jgi:DNA/RNA endonuclease G (NUC1)
MKALLVALLISTNAMAFTECPAIVGQAVLAKKTTANDLCYSKFGVRYNPQANGPDWSIMVIDPSTQNNTPRTNSWHIDQRVQTQVVANSYPDTSVFDKGHLTPADVMTDSISMTESFTLTNQAPQYSGCNRGMWKKYESDTLRYAMRIGHPITVITGVKYNKLSTNGSPSIPTHYWKLVLDGDKSFAFVLPNDPIQCSPKTSVGVDFSPITVKELTKFVGYKIVK